MKNTILKYRGLFLLILSLLLPAAPAPAEEFRQLPQEFDGTMSVYPFEQFESDAGVIPDSLEPVMINYVARHGARFLSSEKKISDVAEARAEAREKGCLTSEGKAFAALLTSVRAATGNRWGALDSLGIAEERQLAAELFHLYPGLLAKGDVTAIATYVPRVVMSMYEFCHSLCHLSSDLNITASEGHRYDSLLRFFDYDTRYRLYIKEGPWKTAYDKFVAENVPVKPAIRLVGELYGLDIKKIRSLTMDIYGVLQSLRAASLEPPTDRWMTREEYHACWTASNLKHFLQRTPNALSPLPAAAAAPLLRSIIESADSALVPGHPVASLRFGHAETLMPLFSLMQIPGCSARVGDDFNLVASRWNDSDVVPLAANLVILSLRSPSGRLYVAMRLNGRIVSPMRDGRPVVPWSELRTLWLQNITAATRLTQ